MEVGPVDILVAKFPGNNFRGEIMPEVKDLVDRRIVRILDFVFVSKDAEGAIQTMELAQMGSDLVDLMPGEGGLLEPTDIDLAARRLEPNTSAGILVFENTWAGPFAEAMARADAVVVESARIPHEAVVAALKAGATASDGEPALSGAIRDTARGAAAGGTAALVADQVAQRRGRPATT